MNDEDGCVGKCEVPEGYVLIKKDRYDDLLQSEKELMRLDDAGVDNWEWNHLRYGDYNEDYWESVD